MKHLHIVIVAFLLTTGCKKDLQAPQLHSPTAVSGFTVSATTVVLSPSNDSSTVAAFSWQAANYAISVPVTYTLQIDQPSDTGGTNAWGKALSTTIATGSLGKSWLGTDFNHMLNQLGLPTGVASTIVVRLSQAVNQSNGITSTVPTLFSTLSMTVTP